MNLIAIKQLFPKVQLKGIEINDKAANLLALNIGKEKVIKSSILDVTIKTTFDVVLIKGVLIHIDPAELTKVYDKLYQAASKYILICEYYNPSPVSIPYRGHADKLFKRDFAGEMLKRFSDLHLIDYGFVYRGI